MLPTCGLPLPWQATGVVVRPHPTLQGLYQTLMFSQTEVRELEWADGEGYRLGPAVTLYDSLPGGAPFSLSGARCPVYEAATESVYFVSGYAVMRLDSANVVSLVAGSREEAGSVDGAGPTARFANLSAMTPAGSGVIYIAEHNSIRKLVVASTTKGIGSGEPGPRFVQDCGGSSTVSSLPNTAPQQSFWTSLAYDRAAGELLACTTYAVCRILVKPQSGAPVSASSTDSASAPALLAGDWSTPGGVDGAGAAARFQYIRGALSTAAHRLCLSDTYGTRLMSPQRVVSTAYHNSSNPYYGYADSSAQYMALLPSGCLAICGGQGTELRLLYLGDTFTKASSVGSEQGFQLRKHLALPPFTFVFGSSVGSSGPCSSSSSSGSAVLNIRVGPDTFVTHRSLLSARSQYFQQLLSGDFAESSTGEVTLPEADPAVFGLLLQYMYTDTLDVPDSLLRPFAELAGRLLVPGVHERLKPRLLAACCTPATAAANLLWAERHSMTDLVPSLKAYLLKNRQKVVAAAPEALRQLVLGNQELAAELLLAALAAP